MLSTSLLTLGLALIGLPGTALSDDLYLNNGPAGTVVSGDWDQDSEIWTETPTADDTTPRQTLGGGNRDTAVLVADPADPTRTITLTLSGPETGPNAARLILSGFRVEGDGYSLRSAQEDFTLGGAGPDDTPLRFDMRDGGTLTLQGIRLSGRILVAGNGTLTHDGDSTGTMTELEVETGAGFTSTGTTAGRVSNSGTTVLAEHVGNVDNEENGIFTLTDRIGGQFENRQNATAHLTGQIEGQLRNRGGTVNVTGPLTTRPIANSHGGILNVNDTGGTGFDLTVQAGDPANPSSGLLNNTATVNLRGDISANMFNGGDSGDGTLNIRGGTVAGNIINRDGSDINGTGTITGSLNNWGTLHVTNGALSSRALTMTNLNNHDSGHVIVDTGHELQVANNINSGGAIDLSGALRIGSGAGTLTTNDNSVTVAGTGQIIGNVVNNGATVNSDGRIRGNLTNNDAARANVSGTITGTVRNSGNSRMALTGDLTVGGLSNTARSLLTVGQDSALTIGTGNGTLVNSAMNGNNPNAGLNLSGTLNGSLNNSGRTVLGSLGSATTATVNGSVTNTGITLLRNNSLVTGNFTNDGRLSSAGFSGAQLNVSGIFSNLAGAVINGLLGPIVISADRVYLNEGGQVLGDVDIRGTVVNAGILLLNTDRTRSNDLINEETGVVQVSADIDAGGYRTDNNGTFTIQNDGEYTNVSTFENNRDLTVQNGGVLEAGQVINGADGITENRGRINGTVTNRGNLINNGRINGDVTNSLNLTSNGAIQGNLINTGNAQMRGTVSGTVENRRNLTTTGNLTVGTLTNRGATTVESNHNLNSGDAVANSATLTVRGTVNTAVQNNQPNARLVMQGGRVADTVTNAGVVTGSGTITGNLANTTTGRVNLLDGQVLRLNGGLRNAGTATLGGTIIGGVNNLAGATTNLRNNGGIQGLVTNRGTLAGNGQITGNVNNIDDGALSLSGRITGTLTQNSSTALQTVRNLRVGTLVNERTTEVVRGTSLHTDRGVRNNNLLQVRGTLASTAQNGTALFNNADSRTALQSGVIAGNVDNNGFLRGNGRIEGNVTNRASGRFSMAGTVTGTFRNNGTLDQFRNLSLGGLVNNSALSLTNGTVLSVGSGRARNTATLSVTNGATLRGTLVNRGPSANVDAVTTIASGGRLEGAIDNYDTLRSDGTVIGDVVTRQGGTTRLSGRVDGVVFNHGLTETTGNLTVDGLVNTARAVVGSGHTLFTETEVQNSSDFIVDGRVVVTGPTNAQPAAATAAAAGNVVNEEGGRLTGSGVLDANVINRGTMTTTGEITGHVLNEDNGIARLRGEIGGTLQNESRFLTSGALSVNGLMNRGNATIGEGHQLTAATAGANYGTLRVLGDFSGDLLNQDRATLNFGGGVVTGDVENLGGISGSGRITGRLINRATDLTLGLDNQHLTVAGGLVNQSGLHLVGRPLTGNLINNRDAVLTANRARINGQLTNNGLVDLSGNGTNSLLTVSGLAGNGNYLLDLDLQNLRGDRIVVDGGAATGHYYFRFNQLTSDLVGDLGRSVTVLEVDQTAANNFTFDFEPMESADWIDYGVGRLDNGDLAVVSQLSNDIGAIFGNITLVHSLIGSVINRPTSPYVVGMAYEDTAKPCGIGSWGRGVGGNAKVTGATSNQLGSVDSSVQASYYGMQVGTDLACFDGHFGGWNMTFGGVLGVNQGDTDQPIYTLRADGAGGTARILSSVTTSDFDQLYGGVYLTASRDRWSFDVQYRRERTEFEITNRAVAGRDIGLQDAKLKSNAHTVSGALSYTMPVARTQWQFVPTAGFAWSKYDIDNLRFNDGYEIQFGDVQSKVGFVGGTLTRTYVRAQQNSALNIFATGTVYKDFADKTRSVFVMGEGAESSSQQLESDHLDTYTELSVGANWVKVLQGGPRRPRQLSAGTRIDARFGDNIDSVGVTGQIRLQF
ncbi:hypothetical protein PE067_02080 [Paracoccus sp. DMF-8]|uniref:hypothetical protein n=1 Tax=Paracoccus sp. DMF-8 TaxID=3019445 RepID=UPI0023E8CC4D|nr:hypothetical protein [Paracoccus sp. DMF-8]MDF3605054.1 hypothetical protein [Paracoccus sp. DMF-8]